MIKIFSIILIVQLLATLNVNLAEAETSSYGFNGYNEASGQQWIYGSNVQIFDSTKGGHTSRALKVIALGVDQDLIASSSNDTTVRIWNTTSGRLVHELDGHVLNVWALAYIGNGQLASGSVDRTIRIWDIASGRQLLVLPRTYDCSRPNNRGAHICNRNKALGHVNDVNTLSYMGNNLLASGSFDFSVRVWNTVTGVLVKSFFGHTATVKTVLYLPFNGFIASVSFDGTARIWDPQGSNEAKFVLTTDTSPINTLTDLKDGRIATAGNNSLINIWDTNTGALLHTFNQHTDIVHALVYLDNNYLVSAGKDKTSRVWSVNGGYSLAWTFPAWSGRYGDWNHRASIYRLVALPNGLFATCSYDRTIKLWDTKMFLYYLTYSNVSVYGKTSHLSGIMSADYVRERIFTTASRDWQVRVWRYDFFHLHCVYRGHTRFVNRVYALENGMVASCSDDYLVKVWNSSSTLCNTTIVFTSPYAGSVGHRKAVNDVTRVRNNIIASASDDFTVKLWNWATKSFVHVFADHTDRVIVLHQLSNGQLASGSQDNTIGIYNVGNDPKNPNKYDLALPRLDQHIDSVVCFDELPNGNLISGSADYNVIVWDATNNYAALQYLEGHWDAVYKVRGLPGNKIVSGAYDNTALVWDGENGGLALLNLTHPNSIGALDVTANGLIVTGCADRKIRIYDPNSDSTDPLRVISGHTSGIIDLQIIPGNFLASGAGDSYIKIWNLNLPAGSELVSTYAGHTSTVNSLAYLTNQFLASGSNDNNVIIWRNMQDY